MAEEWSCYGGGQFKGVRRVDTEVASLIEGEWLCNGGGQCNRGIMIVKGGQFNGGRMVMLWMWPV